MSTGYRIIKNSIFLTISQVLSKVINLGLILVLTRLLGKEGFGLYSFTFAYASLFGFLIHLGLITLLVREIAKHKDRTATLLGSTFPLVILFSGITLLLMNTIAFALDWNTFERTVILIFGVYFVFDTFGRYFLSVTRAFEQMEYVAIINFLERFFLLIMALICWYFQYSLIYLVLLFTFIQLLKALSGFFIVIKYFTRFNLIWWSDDNWRLLKESYPFALIGIFTVISQRIDLIILKYFYSVDVVGIYNAARKLIESLSFIPENIYFAIFPALSVFFISQKDKFDLTFKRTFIVMMIFSVPVSAGLFILAPQVIDLLFEPEFSNAALALQYLALALIPIFIKYVLAAVLNTVGKQYIFAIIMGISMVINIVMNYILIPKYQIIGASLAFIFSELSIILCSIPFLIRIVHFGWLKIFIPKIISLGILISITIYLIKDWPLWIVLITSTAVYISLFFIFRLITLAELKDYYKNYVGKSAKMNEAL
jgi:O-antigen/teichoic acid export membrane protein